MKDLHVEAELLNNKLRFNFENLNEKTKRKIILDSIYFKPNLNIANDLGELFKDEEKIEYLEVLSGVKGIKESFFLFQEDNLLNFNGNNKLITLDILINEGYSPYLPYKIHLTFHSDKNIEDLELLVKHHKMHEGILIFFSYSLEENLVYPIREIAEEFMSFNDITGVLFYEEHTIDNFVKYMNEYIGRCDVLLLFCSERALNSRYVYDEWTTAYSINKPIIPIFFDLEYMPPLLIKVPGYKFNQDDIKKSVKEIYKLIKRRINED